MIGGIHHRGVALVSVLLILATLTTGVVHLVLADSLSLRRLSNQREAEQAFQLAMGAEQWAAKVLARDLRDTKTDHLNEPWNALLPPIKVEDGAMTARLEDAQGRFNINNLAAGRTSPWYPVFVRLLQLLEIDTGVADALVDWLDADLDVSGLHGAEDPQYQLRKPSYRAANQLIADTGELLWVAGMDVKILEKLAPFVTAVPEKNLRLNINTCPPALLRVLREPPLSEGEAQGLGAARGRAGFKDVSEFLARTEMAGKGDKIEPLVTVQSAWFEARAEAAVGRVRQILHSLLHRQGAGQAVIVHQRRRALA
jgi:general secretion pathway protein K